MLLLTEFVNNPYLVGPGLFLVCAVAGTVLYHLQRAVEGARYEAWKLEHQEETGYDLREGCPTCHRVCPVVESDDDEDDDEDYEPESHRQYLKMYRRCQRASEVPDSLPKKYVRDRYGWEDLEESPQDPQDAEDPQDPQDPQDPESTENVSEDTAACPCDCACACGGDCGVENCGCRWTQGSNSAFPVGSIVGCPPIFI